MRSHNISNTVVPMFCTEMDGIESLHDVVIILASNRHDLIDPAILRPGRIDRKIKVNRPDYEAAKSIFSIYLTPSLPVDAAEVAEYGTEEAARAALVEQGVDELFARTEETILERCHCAPDARKCCIWGDLSSGAIIASVVQRAKGVGHQTRHF